MEQTLEQKLAALIAECQAKYSSPEAILVLQKTFQSHNITIEDWNQLLSYLSNNFEALDIQGVYEILEEMLVKMNSDYQSKITSDSKLSSDLVDDLHKNNRFVTAGQMETWDAKQNALTFDSTPTEGSTNPVTSGGVYSAIAGASPEALNAKEDKANKSTSLSNSSTDTEYASAKAVVDYVKDKVSNVYKFQGSKTVSELNALTVTADMHSYVYNVTDSGTLSNGSVQVLAGDNVAIVYNSISNTFTWDKLAGTFTVDLTPYATKVSGATNGHLAGLDSNGNLTDSGKAVSDFALASDLASLARESEIADAYSSSATYAVGAYCIYNNTLYRCTTAVSVAEDFDSTKWTACKIANVMADLDSNQTITGIKNFPADGIKIGAYKIKVDLGLLSFRNQADSSNVMQMDNNGLRVRMFTPVINNYYDLGTSSYYWKDLYLSGKIKDGTNEFNADNVFNVINASDIVNNTLTQAQYDLITNGKPTLIKGTFLNGNATILYPPYDYGTNIGGYMLRITPTAVADVDLTRYDIIKNTLVISRMSINRGYGIQLNRFWINGLTDFNGKTVPAYPSDTTKQYKFVQKVGGNLDYVEDTVDITAEDFTIQ